MQRSDLSTAPRHARSLLRWSVGSLGLLVVCGILLTVAHQLGPRWLDVEVLLTATAAALLYVIAIGTLVWLLVALRATQTHLTFAMSEQRVR